VTVQSTVRCTLQGKRKGKGKAHPITDHEGPEVE